MAKLDLDTEMVEILSKPENCKILVDAIVRIVENANVKFEETQRAEAKRQDDELEEIMKLPHNEKKVEDAIHKIMNDPNNKEGDVVHVDLELTHTAITPSTLDVVIEKS